MYCSSSVRIACFNDCSTLSDKLGHLYIELETQLSSTINIIVGPHYASERERERNGGNWEGREAHNISHHYI